MNNYLRNWKAWFVILYVLASINNAFYLGRINTLVCGNSAPFSYVLVGAIWPLQTVVRLGSYVFGYYPEHWEVKNLCNRSVGTVDGRV